MIPFGWMRTDAGEPPGVATTSRIFSGGSSDRIDLGTWSVVSSTFTMACWFNAVSHADLLDSRFVSKADGVGAANHDWMIGITDFSQNDRRLRVRINRQSNTTVGATNLWSVTNTWKHVIVTYNNGSIVIYLDNVSDGTGTHGSGNLPNNTDTVLIGNQPTSLTTALDGRIAKVGVWNIVLDAGQRSTLYGGGTSGAVDPVSVAPANLVGAWVLGAGSPEPDSSSGGHNGTVTGATVGTFP